MHHSPQIGPGFPVHRTRVIGGAGDEESFETKGSPPAVAGPLAPPLSRRGHAPLTVAGSHEQAASRNTSLLLDLVNGAPTLADSLDLLVAASAAHVVRTAGIDVGCGLMLHQPKRAPAITGTTDEVARLLDWERETAEGPVTDVMSGGHPVAVLQRNGDFRWRRYSSQLQSAGFGSALAVRLRLDTGVPADDGIPGSSELGQSRAALAFFAEDSKAFPLQVIAEARTFAVLAAKSLQMAINLHTARSLATDLRSALDSRTSINVACGVIMAQNRCSYQEAFAILAKASSHRNIKVRKVAEDILERLPEGAPHAHFGR
ncbi:ANTAR domain-containing response regulator [Arthrobacter sp. SAFR-044]|uniref:ANTAR domain-containing response regulator n=1 Tax=Arthrobacter sp. SAFR-044 TaxID=3387278 RepID=UPI003F7CB056